MTSWRKDSTTINHQFFNTQKKWFDNPVFPLIESQESMHQSVDKNHKRDFKVPELPEFSTFQRFKKLEKNLNCHDSWLIESQSRNSKLCKKNMKNFAKLNTSKSLSKPLKDKKDCSVSPSIISKTSGVKLHRLNKSSHRKRNSWTKQRFNSNISKLGDLQLDFQVPKKMMNSIGQSVDFPRRSNQSKQLGCSQPYW